MKGFYHIAVLFFLDNAKIQSGSPLLQVFPAIQKHIREKQGKNNGQQGKQQGKIKNPDTFIGILILFL